MTMGLESNQRERWKLYKTSARNEKEGHLLLGS